jgi:hypothetical protein
MPMQYPLVLEHNHILILDIDNKQELIISLNLLPLPKMLIL